MVKGGRGLRGAFQAAKLCWASSKTLEKAIQRNGKPRKRHVIRNLACHSSG